MSQRGGEVQSHLRISDKTIASDLIPLGNADLILSVEPIRRSTREEREQWIKDAKYNLFNLRSDQVYIDLLTDSGTGAMSDRQWSEMMLGDESYAGASSYFKMKNAISKILGFEHFLPTHQGRAAENVLFSVLVKPGDFVPGNSHFDTTKGHIEFRKAKAMDCTIDEAFDTEIYHPFKGNIDLNKLENVLKTVPSEKISFIIVTVTCNSSGGQPVSMQNLREVRQMADKYGKMVVYDSARFAENAYFIKMREEGYADKSIKEIVKEMFSYADAMTMSSKKDAIVNMGGFIAMRDEELWRQASVFNIMFEGYVTYGGMSGRDMNALAQGLDEGTEFDYLETRIKQIEYLGSRLEEFGIPFQRPVGGHAIFVDAKRILPNLPKEQYVAQTLGVELYVEAGIRGVEIGTILADRDPVTRENRYPILEFLRLAIPRRVYTNNHMDVVAVALKNVFDRRNKITSGFNIVREAPIMRHFTVEMERV
jgi:tryptophanase